MVRERKKQLHILEGGIPSLRLSSANSLNRNCTLRTPGSVQNSMAKPTTKFCHCSDILKVCHLGQVLGLKAWPKDLAIPGALAVVRILLASARTKGLRNIVLAHGDLPVTPYSKQGLRRTKFLGKEDIYN